MQTEREWEKLIHTEGLVIVDIYCAWCFSAITIILFIVHDASQPSRTLPTQMEWLKIQITKVRALHRHGCSSEETAHISPGDTGSPPELTYNHPFLEVKKNSKGNFCTAEQLTKYKIEKKIDFLFCPGAD